MGNYTCDHQHECIVYRRYPKLCYLNMSDEERQSLGGSCPIADEYKRVPEEPNLICPTGLLRKFLAGKTVRGETL